MASVNFKTTQGWDLYKIILDTAIHHLKTDPLQMYVKWCVATWPLSSKEPLIKLFLWNRTLVNNMEKFTFPAPFEISIIIFVQHIVHNVLFLNV